MLASVMVRRLPPRMQRSSLLAGVLLLATTIGAMAASEPVGEAFSRTSPRLLTTPAAPVDIGSLILGPRLALLDIAPRLAEDLAETPRLAQPVVLDSPIVSGLPWRSGMACPASGAVSWRGRALDTGWFGMPFSSWDAMIKSAKSSGMRSSAAATPQPVVTLPLLPTPNKQQFDQCANGDFDGYYQSIGAALSANGAGSAVVRLGKEANRGHAVWSYSTADQVAGYRLCFQRAASALKQGAPNLKIEWTNARQTLTDLNPLDAYPGPDAVDIIGVHYYDNPKLGHMSTQAKWDAEYMQYDNGRPLGLGTWLAAAEARGKKLAVSEWAVWGDNNPAPADVPVYIQNMYQFFKQHSDELEYESYFSCKPRHKLYPAKTFPKARTMYQQLWSAGQ